MSITIDSIHHWSVNAVCLGLGRPFEENSCITATKAYTVLLSMSCHEMKGC